MPTETKVGLCVIAGLMIVLCVVLVRRIRQEFGHDVTVLASRSTSHDRETSRTTTPEPEAASVTGSPPTAGSDMLGASIAKNANGDRSPLETYARQPQPSSPPPRRSAASETLPAAGTSAVGTPLVPHRLTAPDARPPARFVLDTPPPAAPPPAVAEPAAIYRSAPPNRVSFDRQHVQPTVHQQAIAQRESRPRPVAPHPLDRHRQVSGANSSYVVREGDTFFKIAHEQLGDAARWVEIYELNQPGDELLKPGMQVRLPAGATP